MFGTSVGYSIVVNANPGSWWWVNGRQAFPGRRCAELKVPFTVTADAQGRIVLVGLLRMRSEVRSGP